MMYKDNPSGHCLLGYGPQPWMNSIDCLVGVLWPIEDSDLDLILHSLDWILFIYFFIFFMSNSVTWLFLVLNRGPIHDASSPMKRWCHVGSDLKRSSILLLARPVITRPLDSKRCSSRGRHLRHRQRSTEELPV